MENLKEIINYFQKKYPSKRNLDQFYANLETVIKRSQLILHYQEKIFKLSKTKISKIIFLGDDDLTSVALGLSQKFEKIFVLDIDEHVINFIEKISREKKLKIEIFKHNLIKPLPKQLLKEKIQFVFFDPPYTPSALKIWLIRALQIILGSGSNQKRKEAEFLKDKHIFMCYGYTDKSLERGLRVQKLINDFRLVIQEKFRKFNKYINAPGVNNESDLYIIQPTPLVNLKIIDSFKNKSYKEKIYTWEI